MITQALERWHRFAAGESPGSIDGLLAKDVVFYSPIVYTPQQGRDLTSMYLTAVQLVLGAGDNFRYTKELSTGDVAILEFETTVDSTYVNGVDIIRFNEAGEVAELRVMLRPLKAVNLVHERMRLLLAATQTNDA